MMQRRTFSVVVGEGIHLAREILADRSFDRFSANEKWACSKKAAKRILREEQRDVPPSLWRPVAFAIYEEI